MGTPSFGRMKPIAGTQGVVSEPQTGFQLSLVPLWSPSYRVSTYATVHGSPLGAGFGPGSWMLTLTLMSPRACWSNSLASVLPSDPLGRREASTGPSLSGDWCLGSVPGRRRTSQSLPLEERMKQQDQTESKTLLDKEEEESANTEPPFLRRCHGHFTHLG